ncbi:MULTISPECIES: 30S ribosomal protein S12 methylthiotransferase RimO [Kosmotoga]|uniref:Ribosomal protein uS12 methylthiotransferase RimO n=1 Tax=Kosmotoga olearia (strain ATCC BAA-1733 / DSM 21960 / TBF 19.5.1) TaxID=521045 RepID=C5CES1_KOSOT|nr:MULTISPECIES: 30S ribosomal protein S12 methylthiotransferase RimO [Kosmotoga]ACR80251.1 MiaB-like tRNA modifying enzyme YliG [Kosmotoga olearia TBF 19.5.1]MDI3523465.1 ribosomal protein methylthiotransferase [Kosmotoga sp.]MDK2952992.1 ribosomal protein methylthiotransferase [Kosmotoga sp.]OAA20190.1 ribosomal protein S12 methylthiotransferase RimO [Kosmotoga sp. DU53]
MRIGTLVLGCPKNIADMDNFKGIMLKRGHEFANGVESAGIVVIDTCGFIDEAKKESIEEILRLCSFKEEKPDLKVIAVGCLVQRYYRELKEGIPEIDGLIGVTSPEKLADLIEAGNFFFIEKPSTVYDFKFRTYGKPYSYVKIGDGCDRGCAFCSIPSFKGSSRSRPIEEIEKEVCFLVSEGIREIVLVSQDTTQYGVDIYGKQALPDLLKSLNEIPGDFWIRVMYLHPDHLTEGIINSILKLEKVVNYFDVPVQSGSDYILKRMGRTKKAGELKAMFEKIRAKESDVTLRTTIMVGFPGETRRTFEETLEFVNDVKFDKLGGFVYSPEEGTPAYSFKMTIDENMARQYLDELLDLQDEISYELNQRHFGKVLKVLIEENTEEVMIGRSPHFAPEIDGSIFLKRADEAGEFVMCRITGVYEHDLEGVIVDESA